MGPFRADTITENVRDDQLKVIKYNHLIADLVIFHNCHTITQVLKELEAEGMSITRNYLPPSVHTVRITSIASGYSS